MTHHFPLRIYYEDTDAGGVVYHSNYLNFAERARTEWLREIGIDQSDFREKHGLFFVVRHCEVNYLSPARLDDKLEVISSVEPIGNSRITFVQNIVDFDSKSVRATISVTVVCINHHLKPCRIPNDLREALHSSLSNPK